MVTPDTPSVVSEADTDNLAVLIAPHLPLLRRYARALCGTQSSGDTYVAATLEALIADRDAIDRSVSIRVGLYRLFQRMWDSTQVEPDASEAAEPDTATGRVARLTPASRRLLLLTTVEGFGTGEAAAILGIGTDEAAELADRARGELDAQSRARVMIIEDEPIIALDLESIVTGMGHQVVGIADTHASAVALAEETRPSIILADIQLADGSSGISAVKDILESMVVPVIFITAFPERLLTGERTEPTFLITKPFRPDVVEAAISQALFHTEGPET
ncbi:MAG: response regulator [Paracoccaceae bacterium]